MSALGGFRPLAVVSDMDGLLLDSERLMQGAILESSAFHGFPMDEALFLSLVGVPVDGNRRQLLEAFGNAFPFDAYLSRYRATVLAEIARNGLPLKPGAAGLLREVKAAGLPLAIATSTGRQRAEEHLAHAGFLPMLDALVTRDDVENPKPHPEPYLLAAERLGVDPAHCLALEDSPTGVRSAAAAGMQVVMVPDLLPATDELRLLVRAVADDLETVRDWLGLRPG